MAVSRHLEYYRTANSAVRSADPENPSLEPNMEWIGCTVCEIFAFKLFCDLEIWVRGQSKSLKVAPIDRPNPKTSYQNQTSCRSAKRLRSYGHFCISKMAVSRHLGFYRTANSAIRSVEPENPSIEPNMEWIGCTICGLFTFKLSCDLETRVWGHSRSSKMAPLDKAHTTLYSCSIVTRLGVLET